MNITTDGVVAFCAGFLTVSAVVGLLVRFVLLPYLREHLVAPVAAIKDQVTNDHGTNMRDDLDGLRVAIALADRRSARAWAQHLAYSETIADRLALVEDRLNEWESRD